MSKAGVSDEAIVDDFVKREGKKALAAPTAEGFGLAAWLATHYRRMSIMKHHHTDMDSPTEIELKVRFMLESTTETRMHRGSICCLLMSILCSLICNFY